MADRCRILIFFGFSGDSGRTVAADANWSFFLTAQTLRRHLLQRFPDDEVTVACAWHKDAFVNALIAPSPAAGLRIRQIHYVGHGGGGVLSFGYHHPTAAADRQTLRATVSRPSASWLMPAGAKRRLALLWEASLVTGFFSDALAPAKLGAIRSQLAPDALMHVWGCFAGAPTHTFDPPYWDLFNAGASSVDGIARHIARTLRLSTTACWDPAGRSGMNFCHRSQDGRVTCPDLRGRALPHWMWPASARVRWISYDSTGNPDETTINFLGRPTPADRIPPERPPSWFTDEIPTRVTAAPTFPMCSAVRVGV